MLTDLEKSKRQHRKELKSLRNKLSGPNLVWFDSLSKTLQYDFLFEWKKEKKTNKLTKPVKSIIKRHVFGKITTVEVVKYPPNLKHFISHRRENFRKYRLVIDRKRDALINILLNKK
jgi:hypothetical protein